MDTRKLRRWARWQWMRQMVRLNHVYLWGFRGVGLYDGLLFFYLGMRERRFNLYAMAMAYRFFFAVFPGLIFLFTLIPYIPVDDLQTQVHDSLASMVPDDSMKFLDSMLKEFFVRPGFGLISLNLVLTIWSSLSGIKVMLTAMTRRGELFRQRGFFGQNFVAIGLFFSLVVLFLLMVGLVISGEYLIDWWVHKGFVGSGFTQYVLLGINWLALIFLLVLALSVVYYFGPPTSERWPFFSAGSLLAGILGVAAIFFFKWFVSHFASYSKLYGSLSAVMILMVWFYWVSIILLIGFELNHAIARARLHRIRRDRRMQGENPA